MIGLLTAAALLLLGSGLAKLVRPVTTGTSTMRAARLPGADRLDPQLLTRVTGLLELLVAIGAIAIGGRLGSALIAISYTVLATMSIRLMSVARGADCGCFGRPSQISHWHTAVNLGFAAAGLVGSVSLSPGRLATEVADRPGTGLVLLAAAGVLSYLCYLLMTALPELLRAAVPVEVGR